MKNTIITLIFLMTANSAMAVDCFYANLPHGGTVFVGCYKAISYRFASEEKLIKTANAYADAKYCNVVLPVNYNNHLYDECGGNFLKKRPSND